MESNWIISPGRGENKQHLKPPPSKGLFYWKQTSTQPFGASWPVWIRWGCWRHTNTCKTKQASQHIGRWGQINMHKSHNTPTQKPDILTGNIVPTIDVTIFLATRWWRDTAASIRITCPSDIFCAESHIGQRTQQLIGPTFGCETLSEPTVSTSTALTVMSVSIGTPLKRGCLDM